MPTNKMKGLPTKDFIFNSDDFTITDEMKEQYNKNGFVIVRDLLNADEITKVNEAIEDEDGLLKHIIKTDHRKKMILWNKPGNDLTGVISQSQKVAGTMAELMGEEIYPYHGKVVMKDAFTGGAHLWHQDYGYWYINECLYPDMATAYIAVDNCTIENGCLEVLKASHIAGRIDHYSRMEQMEADTERVEKFKKICEHVYVTLKPGDAVFFHCNLLHQAPENHSPNRRYALLFAYNSASNPCKPHFHASYFPWKLLPNSEILKCNNNDMSGKEFLDPNDESLQEQVQFNR